MKIEKKVNGKEITILPIGRLDSNTAPLLEAEINANIDDAEKLILDFAELEYLSSVGLRVLLSAHKTFMKKGSGELVICHVNEIIHEVFEVTGFLDILNIAE
ncbi:MAG: STAS domain-containing protein [Candidatus Gastranaerophilales bacterium]|nr:STAS domain-containing protein [Candidatus Gastranaerophilales bacterium]